MYLGFVSLLFIGMLLVLLARRSFSLREARDRWSDLPDLKWLDPADSPLHRRVLDCRGHCRLQRVDTTDPKIVDGFRRTQGSSISTVSGKLPEGAHPAGHPVRWAFTAVQGPALLTPCLPHALEDKWLIRHAGGRLHFQRSWTGKLIYVAELSANDKGAYINRIWLRDGEARTDEQRTLALALCRYLIDSHLLGLPAAVPVPADLAVDPYKMAIFAFSMAGRRGDYAEPHFSTAPEEGEEGGPPMRYPGPSPQSSALRDPSPQSSALRDPS